MKKLKLNLQQLDGVEVLTRTQLKNVLGGIAPVTTCGTLDASCGDVGLASCCSGYVCTEFEFGSNEHGEGYYYWVCAAE